MVATTTGSNTFANLKKIQLRIMTNPLAEDPREIEVLRIVFTRVCWREAFAARGYDWLFWGRFIYYIDYDGKDAQFRAHIREDQGAQLYSSTPILRLQMIYKPPTYKGISVLHFKHPAQKWSTPQKRTTQSRNQRLGRNIWTPRVENR